MSRRQWVRSTFAIAAAGGCSLLTPGCQSAQKPRQPNSVSLATLTSKLKPSNDRDWKPDLAVLPFAEANPGGDGNQITLRNIRRNQYANADHYVVRHYDRVIDLRQIVSVDYIVCPFSGTSPLAHTMLSFGLDDGTYLCVSVEVRKERDEEYSAVLGVARKFEIMYVLADEQDLIGSRTKHRDIAVYLYPTVATPDVARALFVDIMDRANKLAVSPEFYNSLTNNCTTSIQQHVNKMANNRVLYDWRVLLPSHSARYAYDLGLLDRSIPFDDLRSLSLVNDLSNQHFDDADYSQKIRSRRGLIKRLADRNSVASPTARRTIVR